MTNHPEKLNDGTPHDIVSEIRAVLAAFLMAGAGIGVLSGLSGVFIKAVCEDTGLSRTSFSLIGSISIMVSALAAPVSSKILFGKNMRLAVFAGAIVCGGVPFLYSLSSAVWQFWLASALNGLFLNFVTMLAAGTLLSRTLSSKSTKAVGAAFAATGLFTSAATPLAVKAIDAVGWRYAWAITGAFAALMLVAASWLIPPNLPETEITKTKETSEFKKKLYMAAAAVFIVNFCNLALFNHAMPFLSDIGYQGRAAVIISQAAALMTAARLGAGFVYSGLGALVGTKLLSLSLAVCALCALYLPGGSTLTLYVLTLAVSSTASALPAKALATGPDQKTDRKIYAHMTIFSSLGSALGPLAAGAVFDNAGSYRPMWVLCLFMAILAFWMFSFSLGKIDKK